MATTAVLFAACGPKDAKTGLEKENLKGNVMEYTEYVHMIQTDDNDVITTDTIVSSSTYIFDEKGYIIKAYIEENGEIAASQTTTYDSHGRELKVVTYDGDEETESYTMEYTYNRKGLPVEMLVYVNNINQGREEYTYDGNEQTCTTFIDNSDAMEKKVSVLRDDELIEKVTFYQKVGEDWEEMYYIEAEYNNKGQQTAMQAFKDDEKLMSSHMIYNENGDLVHTDAMQGMELTAEKFEYEYDENGNWTKRMEYAQDGEKLIPLGIATRSYKYAEK